MISHDEQRDGDRASEADAGAAQAHRSECRQLCEGDPLAPANDAIVGLHGAHHVLDVLISFEAGGLRRLLIVEMGGADAATDDNG